MTLQGLQEFQNRIESHMDLLDLQDHGIQLLGEIIEAIEQILEFAHGRHARICACATDEVDSIPPCRTQQSVNSAARASSISPRKSADFVAIDAMASANVLILSPIS